MVQSVVLCTDLSSSVGRALSPLSLRSPLHMIYTCVYTYVLQWNCGRMCTRDTQWNSSNPDIPGPEESGEVSLFQGCPYRGVPMCTFKCLFGLLFYFCDTQWNSSTPGPEESVLICEVSLFQGCPYRGVSKCLLWPIILLLTIIFCVLYKHM